MHQAEGTGLQAMRIASRLVRTQGTAIGPETCRVQIVQIGPSL